MRIAIWSRGQEHWRNWREQLAQRGIWPRLAATSVCAARSDPPDSVAEVGDVLERWRASLPEL
jgi:hypothetical protein